MSDNALKVLVVEPMKNPYVREIEDSLENMQAVVGGEIEAVYPFDDAVALVCHNEGKLLGLQYNRALKDDHGVPYDVVCGTFFLAGIGREEFISLTDEQIKKYQSLYSREMVFPFPNHVKQNNPIKKEQKHHER